jgi:plastocyanin domain-containing protein
MTPIEWTVIAGAVAGIALVTWYFFVAGQTVAVAAPVRAVSAAGRAPAVPEVVIPAFGIRTYLPTDERTTIEVTPTDAGRIPFTCAMGMLKGTILVDA